MNLPNPQRGVSLIEVLVSLVILSLGVLAVVALQLVAKRNNADAGQRTIAAQLAYDLIERMRANCAAATLDAYRTATPLGDSSLSQPSTMCNAGTCTPEQLVTYDLWQWERALDGAAERLDGSNTGGLVQPRACVLGPAGGGDGVYTVAIAWRSNIEMPDRTDAEVAANPALGCGRDPQAAGPNLYSKTGNDNVYRRLITMPVYITARR